MIEVLRTGYHTTLSDAEIMERCAVDWPGWTVDNLSRQEPSGYVFVMMSRPLVVRYSLRTLAKDVNAMQIAAEKAMVEGMGRGVENYNGLEWAYYNGARTALAVTRGLIGLVGNGNQGD